MIGLLAALVGGGLSANAGPDQPRIVAIPNSHEIHVIGAPCLGGSVLAIHSQDDQSEVPAPLGFATVLGPAPEGRCAASVQSHSRNGIIRIGDPARLLDLTRKDNLLPGRYDLLREGQRKVSARYKPLVYAGYLFGHTAATLDKGEFLVGVGPLAYGINNRLQIDTAPLLFLSNTAYGGIKYKIINDEDARVSLHLSGYQFMKVGHGAWSAEIQYDNSSNSRSMSHTKLRYTSKLPDTLFQENRDKEKQGSFELTTVSEWILRDWHRMLFGPKFTSGEERDLGFVFSTILVFDTFHLTLNLHVNSLRGFDFRDYKQVASLDLFWRL